MNLEKILCESKDLLNDIIEEMPYIKNYFDNGYLKHSLFNKCYYCHGVDLKCNRYKAVKK